jgi:predicted dehydrogenase
MTYFTGSLVESVTMSALGKDPVESTDNAIITLRFANGAQGVINYFSNGNKSYSKERIEIHSLERTLILDNFRRLEGFGFKGFRSMSSQQDKGHKEQFRQLIERVKTGGIPLIPFNSLMNTTRTALAAIDSFKSGEWISINSYKKNLSAITDSPPDQKEPISEKTVVI